MNNLEKFRRIKTFIFDLDGVLADHGVFVFENGQIVRKLNEKDLFALKKAIQTGYRVAVITGGHLKSLKSIFQEIGIKDLIEQCPNKKAAYDELKLAYNIKDEEVLYMGDDLPDYQVMRIIGLPTCPKNAAPEIKEIAVYTSPYSGGNGCVRDVIERVLKLKKKWF